MDKKTDKRKRNDSHQHSDHAQMVEATDKEWLLWCTYCGALARTRTTPKRKTMIPNRSWIMPRGAEGLKRIERPDVDGNVYGYYHVPLAGTWV